MTEAYYNVQNPLLHPADPAVYINDGTPANDSRTRNRMHIIH